MKRDGMTRDMEREHTLINRVYEIYRNAVHFKLTFDQVLADIVRSVYEQADYKRIPHYRRAAVRAIILHLFHGPSDLSIHQHLEYRMLYRGMYYADFDTWRAAFPVADASEILTGEHFWKGTDKPYSNSISTSQDGSIPVSI